MLHKLARSTLTTYKKQYVPMLLASLLSTVAMIGQAWLFAVIINGTFLKAQRISDLTGYLYALVVVIALRVIGRYWQERSAGTLALLAKRHLRQRLLEKLGVIGPFMTTRQGDIVHALTDGLENVEQYIARYLPQLIYAMMIPLLTGIAMIAYEPLVGIILVVTLPLIPFFMMLIGKKAESMNRAQWERMSMLSGHFLDVLQGMTTLKLFGRSKEQIQVIARLSGEFRDSTLKVLRVAFLSALVLELISTISTALLAVYLGIALLYDSIPFFPALFILLIAPEFYAPLRQLGAAFHTGMAGKTALERIGLLLEIPSMTPASGTKTLQDDLETITFEDVTFAYHLEDGTEPAVEHVTFTLRRNAPTMLVGESGAGKSTLAHILLRLLEPQSGTIRVNGVDVSDVDTAWWRSQIAYVPQTPYIPMGTIRDSIAFGRDVTDEDIQRAAMAAEAHDFIQQLPQGYDTVLGEGGLGLSGGQRQRIALARAFLCPASILLLDEATAHLDVETEASLARVLQRLMMDKIVLCIGHRLTTMHWVDQLVVMRDGQVQGIGTFAELEKENAYFTMLVQQGVGQFAQTMERSSLSSITGADNITGYMDSKETGATGVAGALRTSGTTDTLHTSGTTDTVGVRGPISETGIRGGTGPEIPVPTESKQRRSISWKDALHAVLPILRPWQPSVWLSVFLSFLTIFMNVGLLTCSAWLIATAALHPDQEVLALAIVGVRFFGISRAVCRYLERLVSHKMAFQGLYNLRVWFYERLEPLAPAILHRWRSGDLLGRIMADIETLQFFYLRVLVPPVGAIVLTIIVAYGLHFYAPILAWVIVCAGILGGIVLPSYVLWHNTKAMEATLQARSVVKERIVDLLGGMLDTITYGQEQRSMAHIQEACVAMERNQSHVHEGVNQGDSLLLLLAQLATLLAVILTVPYVRDGAVAGVSIAVVAFAVLSYFEALGPMHLAFSHGRESVQAMKRLVTIAKEQPVVTEPVTPMAKETFTEAPSIVLHDVSSAYDEKQVFSHLDMALQSGERVALVGPSGAGKTTLLSLLERLYPYEGTIQIGGKDMRNMAMEDVRDLYGTVTQDTYIFHATLEDNIRLAKPKATAEEMEAALAFAQLDSWVHTLPQGLKTPVGHGGLGLSGGQRQRVALARLYLKQRSIVLLDEPLEGLDAVTAHEIRNALYAYTKGKTTIFITHSLQGLEEMDRILFLQDGRICESGTYDELIAKQGAFYQYCCLSMASVS